MPKQPDKIKKLLLEALERHLGIITYACKEIGVERNRYYHYYKTDPDFKKAADDINEIVLDFVENQLITKIREGSERSIMFYMKYKGKTRGYENKVELTGNNLDIKVNFDNNEDNDNIEPLDDEEED